MAEGVKQRKKTKGGKDSDGKVAGKKPGKAAAKPKKKGGTSLLTLLGLTLVLLSVGLIFVDDGGGGGGGGGASPTTGARAGAGAGAGAGGDEEWVYFDEDRKDGMPAAAFERYTALWEKAVALQQDERLPDALAAYREALTVRPNDANSLVNIGSIYAELDEAEKSKAAFTQALQHQPSHFHAHANLAGYHDRRGELDAAEAMLKKALALNPAHENTLHFMQDLQARRAQARSVAFWGGCENTSHGRRSHGSTPGELRLRMSPGHDGRG